MANSRGRSGATPISQTTWPASGAGEVGAAATYRHQMTELAAACVRVASRELEHTDGGWGVIVLLGIALPVAVCAALGALVRTRVQAQR